MNPPKPLTYLSLQCVLGHMDPSWRYLNRFKFPPTVRKMMRDSPLHIEDLKLDETSFTVNTVKFYVGTFFEDSEGNLPETIPMQYRDRGLPYDVFRNGLRDFDQPLALGDIRISSPSQGPSCQAIPNFKNFQCYTRLSIFDLQLTDSGSFREVLRFAHRFPGGVKVHEVIRRLLNNFFENFRNSTPLVKNLEILAHRGTLKLPEHLKLNVRNLIMEKLENRNSVMNSIKPILAGPLDSVTGYFLSPGNSVLGNEVLKNTRVMNIKAHTTVRVILKCPTLEICVFDTHFKFADILEIIRDWMEHPRRMGSKLTLVVKTIASLLVGMEETLEEAKKGLIPGKWDPEFPTCLTIPLDNYAELNIYGMGQAEWTETRGNRNRYKDIYVMEVMEKGTAQLLER